MKLTKNALSMLIKAYTSIVKRNYMNNMFTGGGGRKQVCF